MSALWDSLVTFRAQAADLISTSASPAIPERLHLLLLSLAVSGAPLVVAAALLAARGRGDGVDLRWAGASMVMWEVAGAALGGSYWLHYLIPLTPGMVVLVAAAAGSRGENSTAVEMPRCERCELYFVGRDRDDNPQP